VRALIRVASALLLLRTWLVASLPPILPSHARVSRGVALGSIIVLGAGDVVAGAAPGPAAPVRQVTDGARDPCAGIGVTGDADELLEDRWTLAPHPTVTLPRELAWDEDPFEDRNWQFQLHSLRYVRTLLLAWRDSDDPRYRDRAVELMEQWLANNPRGQPPSPFSWDDHATAWRARTMACAASLLGLSDWLREALQLHGRTLAEPDFYLGFGNHALNQNVALLDVGCVLDHRDWMALARDRLEELIVESVDAHGVTNEQAIEYQAYNFAHYSTARDALIGCGLEPPAAFARIDLMPTFLAHATLPNGEYELIGDTGQTAADVVEGTIAEFAATGGVSGPRPTRSTVIYPSSGWAFARTGWGEDRPFEDEIHTSLRFGPPQFMHGHLDGGSVTLYGYGERLLVDAGKYRYEDTAWRDWFVSREAHNVVVIDGVPFDEDAATPLVAHRTSRRHTDTTVATTGYPGVRHERRVIFSRELGYLIVEDRVVSEAPRRVSQLWHLMDGTGPAIGTSGILTRRDRGNLVIRQLAADPTIRIVAGATDPIQGWISYGYGERIPAPVVEASMVGSDVRYLTLIVPGAARPQVRIDALRLTDGGFSLELTIDDRSEYVTATRTASVIGTP
jgi:hypothetical protein